MGLCAWRGICADDRDREREREESERWLVGGVHEMNEHNLVSD